MRQMRLEKREIKDPAELEKVLDACKVVRIGAMDAEGMFIVPVNFGYEFCQKERGLKLYIHSAKEGRKAEAFAENPNVAIEMDCGHEVIRGDYTCREIIHAVILLHFPVSWETDEFVWWRTRRKRDTDLRF